MVTEGLGKRGMGDGLGKKIRELKARNVEL